MSDKPTTTPGWAATGVTPSAGEKSAGFASGDRLPADYVDWFWKTVSDWVTWLDEGYLTRASLSDDSPVLALSDQDGNARSYIDAQGYRMGDAIELRYVWKRATSAAAGDDISLADKMFLTFEETGYIVTVGDDPTEALRAGMVRINCTASPTAQNGVIISCDDSAGASNNDVVYFLDDAVIVMEGSFVVTETTNSASSFYFGMGDPQDPSNWESSSAAFCGFVLDYGETAIEAMTGNQTTMTKTAVTGGTIAVNTLYRLRVEYHGTNTPQGVDNSGAIARFFLNGTLVLETQTTLPLDAHGLGPCFGVQGLGSDTASDVYVGPVKFAFNQELSPVVPS